jgi:hypothetical protein
MRAIAPMLLAAFGVGLIATAARADIPPPAPPPQDVKFVIELDEKAKGPVLYIPVSMTKVRFRPGGPKERPPTAQPPGKEPLAILEYEEDVPTPRNPNHLMIAGVALTLAFGLGGVWLVRRQGRWATRGLALLVAAGGTLAVSTIVWANAAPPPPPGPRAAVLPVALTGEVRLVVPLEGDTIRLVLDKPSYEKMKIGPGEK